jgi:hypothetical protein
MTAEIRFQLVRYYNAKSPSPSAPIVVDSKDIVIWTYYNSRIIFQLARYDDVLGRHLNPGLSGAQTSSNRRVPKCSLSILMLSDGVPVHFETYLCIFWAVSNLNELCENRAFAGSQLTFYIMISVY